VNNFKLYPWPPDLSVIGVQKTVDRYTPGFFTAIKLSTRSISWPEAL